MKKSPNAASLALIFAASLAVAGEASAKDKKHAPAHPAPAAEAPAAAPAQSPAAPAVVPTQPEETHPAPILEDRQSAAPVDPKATELDNAFKAGAAAATKGPANVALLDLAELRIPAGMVFIPKNEGSRILRALGNTISADGMTGVIMGVNDGDSWIVVVRRVDQGHIRDDEAKDWNTDELLRNIKANTEEANTDRKARGFPQLDVAGWIEKPTYDASQHRLVWSILARTEGVASGDPDGVNYNTFALGRDGFFSLNMITDSSRVEKDKEIAKTLLSNLSWLPGKSYADFDESTDKVAAYGLAALVGGVAAKKLGLFAIAAAFLAKFAKLAFVAVIAAGAGLMKFLRNKLKKPEV